MQEDWLTIPMRFDLVAEIKSIETIAEGLGIRDRRRLNKQYGSSRWKKKKGITVIVAENGVRARVELHWYEAPGIGKRELKVKTVLEILG